MRCKIFAIFTTLTFSPNRQGLLRENNYGHYAIAYQLQFRKLRCRSYEFVEIGRERHGLPPETVDTDNFQIEWPIMAELRRSASSTNGRIRLH